MLVSGERSATLCGLAAIGLWSTSTALIRSVTQVFGPLGGTAILYSIGAVLLLVFLGRPRLRRFSKFYLLVGTSLFVAYEVCLSLAVGYAASSTQVIEVVLVNYLWPSLTILLAIVMNGQRARWSIIPGTAVALFGVLWVLSGDGLSWHRIVANVVSNPVCYGLGLSCAVTFALYCNVTRRYAGGGNAVTLFFVLTAGVLWTKYAFSSEVIPPLTWGGGIEILAAGVAMAGGYALWNIGILRGDLTLLATASYSAPVLTSAFAALWLGAALTVQFWQGALLVMVGSLICWTATRELAARKLEEAKIDQSP